MSKLTKKQKKIAEMMENFVQPCTAVEMIKGSCRAMGVTVVE